MSISISRLRLRPEGRGKDAALGKHKTLSTFPPVWSRNSSSLPNCPLIVLEQTTQSFPATHDSVIPARPSIRHWEQEPVLLALVIALLVVMCHVLLQGSAQRPLPEQDQLRQAFLFHRSHPAFRIGVQIRAPRW